VAFNVTLAFFLEEISGGRVVFLDFIVQDRVNVGVCATFDAEVNQPINFFFNDGIRQRCALGPGYLELYAQSRRDVQAVNLSSIEFDKMTIFPTLSFLVSDSQLLLQRRRKPRYREDRLIAVRVTTNIGNCVGVNVGWRVF
jgi:hypothetical protein